MWSEFLFALLLSVSNVLIHSLGSYAVFLWLLLALKKHPLPSLLRGWWMMIRFLIVLLVLHALEAALWGQFYFAARCFPDAGTAYYYSLTSYTTVGFGDVVLSRPWRFMGGWEAMIGVLMFGWSTASVATFLHHLHDVRLRELRPRVAD